MAVDLKSSGAEALPQIPGSEMDATAAAAEADRLGTAIGNTQVVQNKDSVPEEWTGAAADSASTEIQALGTKVKTLAEAFPTAAKALNDWDYQLRGVRGKIGIIIYLNITRQLRTQGSKRLMTQRLIKRV